MLTTLTPVHVGSGEVLRQNIDYIVSGGRITGLNMSRLFSAVENMGQQAITSFTLASEKSTIAEWLRKSKINSSDYAVFEGTCQPGKVPPEIRRHQRDGFGIPYFPGSSIKGALRTAVVAGLLQDKTSVVKTHIDQLKKSKTNTKFPDQSLLEQVLGSDPKLNLMRCLSVGDALFHNSRPAIGYSKTASMNGTKGYIYKPFQIFVECLKMNQTAEFQLSLDSYLAESSRAEKLEFKSIINFRFLRNSVRDLTQRLVRHEIDFCTTKLDHKELATFYKNDLYPQMSALAENEIIFNIGWGIGWLGMTGGILTQSMLDAQLRKVLHLADKRIGFPFPKTRKTAEIDSRITPWGWVKVEFHPYSRSSAENNMPQTKIGLSPVTVPQPVPPAPPKPPVDPAASVMGRIDALPFQQIAGQAPNIVPEIEKLEPPQSRAKAAKHFLAKIGRDKKKFKEKVWFQKLHEMAGSD